MSRTQYRVAVTREGSWWVIYVPAVDYRSQARTLTAVDELARDLIATSLDIEPDAFDLDVQISRPKDIERVLAQAIELDRESQAATAKAARERRIAARELRTTYRMSAIDTARVLGVTRARVYQLLNDDKASA